MGNKYLEGKATFVMPFWTKDLQASKKDMDETIKGILNQTDKNWQIVIVDDASPSQDAKEYLKSLEAKMPDKIHVILNDKNEGPGQSRNIGIEWANKTNSPIILFNDSDDISHPDRLKKVREIFANNPEASLVYSTFNIIDESGKSVEYKKLSPSICEILDGHKNNPPQGKNAWIDIATETGYINLTSSTSVKTDVAFKYPFPKERVSEDQHTWLRYSAGGDSYVYEGSIPSEYRIPQNTGSASRAREGDFYATKERVDTDGFKQAISIAIDNKKIDRSQVNGLWARFYVKEAETLAKEGRFDIAERLVQSALVRDENKTKQLLKNRGLQKYDWAKTSEPVRLIDKLKPSPQKSLAFSGAN